MYITFRRLARAEHQKLSGYFFLLFLGLLFAFFSYDTLTISDFSAAIYFCIGVAATAVALVYIPSCIAERNSYNQAAIRSIKSESKQGSNTVLVMNTLAKSALWQSVIHLSRLAICAWVLIAVLPASIFPTFLVINASFCITAYSVISIVFLLGQRHDYKKIAAEKA